MSHSEIEIQKGQIYRFPESACIFVTDALNRFLVVRQFRKPSGCFTFELPGGVVRGGETPEETALRELKEETGLQLSTSRFLFTLDLDLSTSIHRTHVFTAFQPSLSPAISGEFECLWTPWGDGVSMIRRSDITHAPTVAAVLSLRQI